MLKIPFTFLLLIFLGLAAPLPSHAAATPNSTISDEPLGTGTGVAIKPNIYFVFDDSGSMAWNYLPDYVNDSYCFDNNRSLYSDLTTSSSTLSGSGTTGCQHGYPPYDAAGFNYLAYDPAIRYWPATDYDGTNTVYKSMSSANTSAWTVVPQDAYGVLKDSNGNLLPPTDLVTRYPDIKWCNGSSTTDCRVNSSGYQYPDLIKYTTAVNIEGAPYYYTMAPAYYCTDYTGTSCQATSDNTHKQAFNYLWCQSYSSSSKLYTGCQGLRDSTHSVPTFLGKTSSTTAIRATGGSITVTDAALTGHQITGITVAGVQLIASTLTASSGDTKATIATAICNAVHANSSTSGFDCPTAPTGATVILTAIATGAANNGSVIVGNNPNVTLAIGSFQVGSQLTTLMQADSILVGATQLLASGTVVTANALPNITAKLLCQAINANTLVSQYQARVVSTLGSASPTWGAGTACTSNTTGAYVEIQSLINLASENGKTISVTGPAAARASATIVIKSAPGFTAGTRPGNLGSITTINSTTLFNSIASSNTTTVANSNSQSSIDTGLRTIAWASPTGFDLSGSTGNLVITAPAGSTYNGASLTIGSGSSVTSTLATTTITFTATTKNKILTGLTCGGTDVITAASYSTGSSNSTAAKILASSINGKGINSYSVSCVTNQTSCTITAPTISSSCSIAVKPGTDTTTISIGGGTFTVGLLGTDNLFSAFSSTSIKFDTSGADGAIPVSNLLALSGFTVTVPGGIANTTTPFTGGVDSKQRTAVGNFSRVDIIGDGRTFAKTSAARDDCAGSACTYAEEMTNFANWYAYYNTRCDMMKTGIFRAFAGIGEDRRLGFNDIYDGDHLDLADFTLANKQAWYAKIKSKTCSGSNTPLQKGLAAAGRYYAGKIHTTVDPIQYSCQRNYTILSTDGYWNKSSTFIPTDSNNAAIGNVDGTTGINTVNTLPNKPPAPYYDSNARSGTLADVAKWYYDHDLRNGPDSINDADHGWGSSSGTAQAHYSNSDVRPTDIDPATWQHMVTFTLGLGMDGLLHYDPDYLTGASADYEALKAGTKSWGVPGDDKQENVDDLWHAAVNGHGQYFSARNPNQLVSSLGAALNAIDKQVGAASASATSSLEPVAGDNYLYAASYATDWTGDLEAQTVSVLAASLGQVSTQAQWSAQTILQNRNLTTSPRVILTYAAGGTGVNGKAKALDWAGLTSTEKAYFGITGMSNYIAGGTLPTASGCNTGSAPFSPTACSPLLDYLKGASTGTAAAFRTRAKILGDIVNTQPVFVGTGRGFSYSDADYSSMPAKSSKTVYVSANDGMLHAFDADGVTGGAEKWAYVPSFVLPNLWQIADANYAGHHKYFVDGPLTAGDVYINSQWRTVLVGGLGKGGNGYFALDVTDPAVPVVLWEFTDSNMGYTYGNPEITKLADGTWVAIFTSGYDNVSDGQGHLYVVNIATGSLMYRIDTGVGSPSNPSNLGKIATWVANSAVDNTALYVYGGDMLGNMWRFTLPTTTPSSGATLTGYPNVLKIFAAPSGQMITVKPELGSTDGSVDHRMVFFGTGRYLSLDDKTDQTTQSIYGLYDDSLVTSSATLPTQANLVQQTLCGAGLATQPTACNSLSSIPSTYRTTTTNAVPLGLGTGTTRGWYVNLPDAGVGSERVNINPILQLGTLVVISNVPTSSDCNAGGYSWKYYLDYKTGSFIPSTDPNTLGLAGLKEANALAVGQAIVRIGDKVISLVTTSDKKYPSDEVRIGANGGDTKRVGWREVVVE